MIPALLLLSAALLAVYFTRWSFRTPALASLAAVIVLLSVARLWQGRQPVREIAYADISEAAGYKLGLELAQQFPDGGKILAIQSSVPGEAAEYLTAAEITGLEQGIFASAELKGIKKGLSDSAIEIVVVKPADVGHAEMLRMESLTVQALRSMLKLHPDAKAVVSFLGIPLSSTPKQLADFPPIFLMVYGNYNNWIELVRTGAVTGVITPKPKQAWTTTTRKDLPPLKFLELRYTYVDQKNLEAYIQSRKELL